MKRTLVFASLALAAVASAQVRFSEFAVNPRGTDNGQEFFELSGAAGTSLDGLWLLSIEGDNTSQGLVDQAISLQGQTIGSNGLFLLRDSATVLPGQNASANTLVYDFNPDLENGSNSYLIVRNYTGFVPTNGQNNLAGQSDLDVNNDGVADDPGTFVGSGVSNPVASPWFTEVLDSVGWTEGDSALDRSYAAYYGGTDFGATNLPTTVNSGAAPDYFMRLGSGVGLAGEYASTPSGSPARLSGDAFKTVGGSLTAAYVGSQTWSPGGVNPVPEPASMIALGVGAVGLLRRRRK